MVELTSKQLSEWEAYDRLDPIGSWRDDFRTSFLATLITNLTISVHGKRGAAFKEIKDFLFEWDKDGKVVEPKKQTVEEMKEILLGIAATQNRKVEREKRFDRPPKGMNKMKGL